MIEYFFYQMITGGGGMSLTGAGQERVKRVLPTPGVLRRRPTRRSSSVLRTSRGLLLTLLLLLVLQHRIGIPADHLLQALLHRLLHRFRLRMRTRGLLRRTTKRTRTNKEGISKKIENLSRNKMKWWWWIVKRLNGVCTTTLLYTKPKNIPRFRFEY